MQRRSLTQVRRLAVRNLLAHFGDQTTVLASARSAITAVQNALKSI